MSDLSAADKQALKDKEGGDSRVQELSLLSESSFSHSLVHKLRIAFSALLLVLWCVFMILLNLVWRILKIPKLASFYMVFHRGCCWIFNLRCHYQGSRENHQPTLFLVNHVSYLDVFVLGGCLPGFFIAKSEVAGWPILGALAKIQNTLFFERNSKKVRGQLATMSQHFDQGENLFLFPEGTSTEGEHVEPFKSSLLQSVEASAEPVHIQPVTIAYSHYDQAPMDRAIRDQYAWYGTMPFAPHFFNALGLPKKADVKVIFHPSISLSDFSSRKECVKYCQKQVAEGLASAINN